MASPSKSKGNRLEKKIVDAATANGIKSTRAWGSNGKALGLTEDVDLLLGPFKVQAKARKAIAEYMKPPPGADITIVQEIRKGHSEAPLVVIPLPLFLSLLKREL